MKETIVIHSGGMDSSICLALALREFGREGVISLSFSYGQRNSQELTQARAICKSWGVDHVEIDATPLAALTSSALTDHTLEINQLDGAPPNTLVLGRNGLMARLAAIWGYPRGVRRLYMGVIEAEGANPGYRDCSRAYIDLKEQILRIDLNCPTFEIRTPLVKMNKKETLTLAYELGYLPFLLEQTITCYEGLPRLGCQRCPACLLRNEGLAQFQSEYPDVELPYSVELDQPARL